MIEHYGELLAIVSIAVNVLLLIIVLVMWSKFKKTEKAFKQMLNNSEVPDLQSLIIDIQTRIQYLKTSEEKAASDIVALQGRLAHMKGHIGFCRYNAFQGQGNDLSFSVALIDDKNNGVVLTGIHGREESYMYGKPLSNGESSYSLSPEERKAISLAQNKEASPV